MNQLKVTIVNYEQGQNNGILSKFANKLNEQLVSMNVLSKVSPIPDPTSDVNHHINYLPYKKENSPDTINTLMITHIWKGYKLDAVKKGMETADMGICMSGQTQSYLEKQKIPRNKLRTILPAHNGIKRRHQIVAILTNVYPDGCKKAEMFTDLVKTLDYNQFAFRIMGSGWTDILVPLIAEGLQVDYFHDFDKEIHQRILESSDYALYFGEDEGSMGLLDATNAGLKTIGIPQGFHIEMGLDYKFNNQKQLNAIFKKLIPENRVKTWTWPMYAKQHINIWQDIFNTTKKK